MLAQYAGLVASAGAANASPYAALGTILYESAGGAPLAIPFDTGVSTPAAGTVGLRVTWNSIATGNDAACGNGGTFGGDPGVLLMNLTNGQLRGRLIANSVFFQTAHGTLTNGVYASCILAWSSSTVISRVGASEGSATVTETGYAGPNMWIGTTDGNATFNLDGGIRKAVFYSGLLSSGNRASLITLLNGEGP